MKKIKTEEYSKWDKNLYKELTPLQALKEVKKYYPFKVNEIEYLNIDIIENALKELENRQATENVIKTFRESPVKTHNRLKALEIIKECFDLNGFDELIPNHKWFESEEKQNLLKEVLK